MFFREKYKFDRNSVRFEMIKPGSKEQIKNYVSKLGVFFIAAIVFNVLFNLFFDSPKLKNYKREQSDIELKYQMLNMELLEIEEQIGEMQHRDDQIYRPIFEERPIPATVREAGFGGINKYAHLENFSKSGAIVSTAQRLDKILKKIYIQSKSYDYIISLAKNKDKMVASVPAIQPIAIKDLTRISSFYGWRSDPFNGRGKFHEGMDFKGAVGTDVFATGDGIVREAEYSRYGYGLKIVIDHGYGYTTRYAHLSKILVKVGQKVKRGEVIGLLGNTGRSTGAHLHYEVRRNGASVNPINYYFNDISSEQYDLMVKLSAMEGGETMD